jgi:hypothetical protein
VPDREGLTAPLTDGFILAADGIRRTSAGIVEADLSLIRDDRTVYQNRAKLGTDDGRGEWANSAASATGVDARELTDAMLAILQEASALLQEDTGGRGPSQATILADLGRNAELWHTAELEAWATLETGGHREHWPLRSKAFKRWLAHSFYEERDTSPGSQAIQDALAVLEGEAVFSGPEHPVYMRVAEHGGAVYLDMADAAWRAIQVDSNGWRVVSNPPVRFRRASGMLPLPEPVKGDIARLWEYVNIGIADRSLITAWLAAALRARGPYPLLGFVGEQGFGKSTNAKVARSLIDPNSAPLRSESRDIRDMMVAAKNNWIVGLDNLSRIPEWASDALCRLATGGGFATRELYSDSDEIIFEAQRPVVITAIDDVINRGDLLDRTIPLAPPSITEISRRSERDFWTAFEQDRPAILGALLDAVSAGLKHEPTVHLDELPRMADFAKWGVATESGFGWEPGTFLTAYANARESANETALDASPVWPVLTELLDVNGGTWEGTATELLDDLNATGEEDQRKRRERSKQWPKSAQAIANVIRRLAPNMRDAGIEVSIGEREGKSRRRLIRLEQNCNEPSAASAPSADSDFPDVDAENEADNMADNMTGADNPPVRQDTSRPPTCPPDFPYSDGENDEYEDMADEADSFVPTSSNGHQPVCSNCGNPPDDPRSKLSPKSGLCRACVLERAR